MGVFNRVYRPLLNGVSKFLYLRQGGGLYAKHSYWNGVPCHAFTLLKFHVIDTVQGRGTENRPSYTGSLVFADTCDALCCYIPSSQRWPDEKI